MKRSSLFLIAVLIVLVSDLVNAQGVLLNNIVVKTMAGKVRGRLTNGIIIFKNIPYAAPPVGKLRFAAPVKPLPWNDIRDAIKSGPTPPNPTPKAGDIDNRPTLGKGWVKGDDFLTANVWTPEVKGSHLPVMVYIYGGAFVMGASDVPLFDGTNFAKKGVVMVSFNYRLGIEGFLKIDGVPTSIGIRDQIAALKWVQNNIAAFGGDSANVTIFGESAGTISVGVLLTSPATIGLFKGRLCKAGRGRQY